MNALAALLRVLDHMDAGEPWKITRDDLADARKQANKAIEILSEPNGDEVRG